MFTVLALMLAQSAAPAAATPAPIPSIEEATKRIEQRDAELFWYAFEGCDGEKLRPYLTDDFRMVHDQGGIIVEDGDTFAAQVAQSCADRAPGGPNEGYKNKRLLVPGTHQVTPVGEWGVAQRGWHTFHELRQRPAGYYGEEDPGGPAWVQVGGAYFLNLWQWMPEEGKFRMQETISIDHGSAPAYPPVP